MGRIAKNAKTDKLSVAEKNIINRAMRLLERQAIYGTTLTSPEAVKKYIQLAIGFAESEEFWAIWLSSQHQVIKAERLFNGTINATSVYPREVLKSALRVNAGAVIFAHNHPSGVPDPSSADVHLTKTLKSALSMIDVKTLDHFIVAGPKIESMMSRGLI